jgi:PHD/YefM family antitoxin component YafN of YafNO toxin-antitoxin module
MPLTHLLVGRRVDNGTVNRYCYQSLAPQLAKRRGCAMPETTANDFRKRLKAHIDRTILHHEVLKVTRRNGENFVVLGEKDWRAIEETLYLNRVPGLVESIHEAAQEPKAAGTPLEQLDW